MLSDVATRICALRQLRYVGLVGEGVFKQTFRAEGEGRTVAVKVFKDGFAHEERAAREFDAMLRCRHDSIVRLIEIDQIKVADKDYLFCLEEFLDGGSLEGRVQGTPLSRTALLEVGRGLIRAIGHLAESRIVHRDIKAANVMFRKQSDVPVLVDFGIVRALDRSTLTDLWLQQGPGTPYYAAPEQLNNDQALIDWRTDQFALGVTIFLCAFGFHPFGGLHTKRVDAVTRVAKHGAVSPEARQLIADGDLPPLERMLRPWPAGRFRRPQDLAVAWEKMR